MILQSILYAYTTIQQPLVCHSTQVRQCSNVIIASPDNFNPDLDSPEPLPSPKPSPIIPRKPIQKPIQKPTAPQLPATRENIPSITNSPPRLTLEADRIAAVRAWKYFERNWNPQTGLVNSSDNIPWTTWWDQGSAILGTHAAYKLGLVPDNVFNKRISTLLHTLEKLPRAATGLPNKAYSTHTAQMRQLNDTPDPKGISGWSALDMARLLLALHVIRSHYPEFSADINRIVTRWNLSKLVKDGWLNGGITGANGQILEVQEGRFGYEQYAAESLKLWNIEAPHALKNPPIKAVIVDGITLQIDKRNFKNSGATNYLTNDPYMLWGLELGWTNAIKPQVENILKVQAQRFERTGILTAVNEDSRLPCTLFSILQYLC